MLVCSIDQPLIHLREDENNLIFLDIRNNLIKD